MFFHSNLPPLAQYTITFEKAVFNPLVKRLISTGENEPCSVIVHHYDKDVPTVQSVQYSLDPATVFQVSFVGSLPCVGVSFTVHWLIYSQLL